MIRNLKLSLPLSFGLTEILGKTRCKRLRYFSTSIIQSNQFTPTPVYFTVKRQSINPFRKPVLAWLTQLPSNSPVSFVHLDRWVFGAPARPDLVYEVDKWYRAGIRAGTACTKTRAEVRGSNAKGRPQKYTGRARMGCKRAPHYRKGGVSHGPKPRNFEYPLDQKIRNAGLRVALTAKLEQDKLIIATDELFDQVNEELSPTNELPTWLPEVKKNKKILFIDTKQPNNYVQELLGKFSEQLEFHCAVFNEHEEFLKKRGPGRNIPFRLRQLNAYHLLRASQIIISLRAVRYLEGYLSTGK